MSRTLLIGLLIAAVAILVLAALYLLRSDTPGDKAGAGDSSSEQSAQPPAPTPSAPEPGDGSPPEPPISRQDAQAAQVERSRAFTLSKNRDFSYYGKIVDQDGKAVPGVQITAQLFFFNLAPSLSGQVRNLRLMSDLNGRFEIKDENARMLSFQFEKPGYRFEPSSTEGILLDEIEPAALTRLADPDNPVIVPAWKEPPPDANVLSGVTSRGLAADGRFHGVKVGKYESLVEVAFERAGTYRSPGDWSVRLRVPGGAVQEHIEGFPYAAPDSGYSQLWEARFATGNSDYALSQSRRFFIRAPQHSLYGNLQIEFRPFYSKDEKSAVFVDYRLNPGGSRNLLAPEDR